MVSELLGKPSRRRCDDSEWVTAYAEPVGADCYSWSISVDQHPHINEYQLSKRWQVSVKKLQKDRLTGEGIPFLRIGRSIRYRMSDVLAFEEANMMTSTSTVLALPAPSLPSQRKAGNRRKGR